MAERGEVDPQVFHTLQFIAALGPVHQANTSLAVLFQNDGFNKRRTRHNRPIRIATEGGLGNESPQCRINVTTVNFANSFWTTSHSWLA
jgi:hypothetical protein